MYNALDSQWNTTDGPEKQEPASVPPTKHSSTVRIESVAEPTHDYVRVDPSARPINLAAFAGVGVVLLLGAMFYLGIGNLRGDLIPPEQVVILRADGFTPDTLTLAVGGQFSLKNDSGQPQVLKSDTPNGPITTPQILFDATPVLVTASASLLPGTYEYYSETMSAEKKLTIIASISGNSASSTSSTQSAEVTAIDDFSMIPIPFDIASTDSTPSSVSPSSSPFTYGGTESSVSSSASSIATIKAVSDGDSGNVVLDLTPTSSSQSSQTQQLSGTLPTNALTVGNNKNTGISSSKTTSKPRPAASNQTIIKPLHNAATGPTEWLPIVLTVVFFGCISRRMMRAS
ncbi:MAG: hypothetical protein KBD00_02350 [Candidatus Peribacteraceae bacterium]|nr:hypothetical protein [Candidatus Peribacteraceae bacterium]